MADFLKKIYSKISSEGLRPLDPLIKSSAPGRC